ncbi:glycosyltransferase [Kriegella sp. EG-1]|nr:glycosyltransferase [Flavobacteriaceae bacterium EG-1]
MKCLHICNDFLGSKVHSQLYLHIDELGVEQHIFHPLRKFNTNKRDDIIFANRNISIYYSKILKNYHRIFFRLKVSFLYKNLLNQLDVSNISIVHATTLFSDGALALKCFQQYKIPYLVTVRNTDLDAFSKYRPDLLFLGLRILKNATKIVFITQSLKNNFYKHYFFRKYKELLLDKSIIVTNGINQFWIENKQEQKKLTPTRILYVGSLLSRKNVLALIEAVLRLKATIPEIELTIVGDKGGQKEQIISLSKANPECIKFIGAVHNIKELLQLYKANHIFAMPSFSETFGLVYIEALSQGLPILYSKNDGVDGTFSMRVGEGVIPKSEESIAKGLQTIINNYAKYKIEDIDFQLFSWGEIAGRYVQIYESVT